MSAFLSKKIVRVSFILSIVVLVIHALNYNIYGVGIGGEFFRGVQSFFAEDFPKFAVPLFFIISGFLFFFTANSLNSVFVKMKKRVFTLLIPFLIWNTVYTLIILVGFNLPFLSDFVHEEAVGGITFTKILKGVFLADYSGHLWFVQSQIFYITLTPIFFYMRKNQVVKYSFLGLFAVINIVHRLGLTGMPFDIVNNTVSFFGKFYADIHNLFFFYLGICLVDCKWFYNWQKQNSIVSAISLVLLFAFAILSKILRNDFFQIDFITLYPMIALAWIASDLFVTEKTLKIEKISFFIYCTHYILQMILKRITYILLGNNVFSLVVGYFIVSIALTLAIIIGMALFLNKYLPKVFKVISGGRTL